MNSDMFYATISWDGYIDEDGKFLVDSDGGFLIRRKKLSWLIEGVAECLEEFSARRAYLETASKESENKAQDITDLVKKELQIRKHKEIK